MLGKPRTAQRTEGRRDPLFPPLKRGAKNTNACDGNNSNKKADGTGNLNELTADPLRLYLHSPVVFFFQRKVIRDLRSLASI